jgi:hypothetical protein
VSECVKIVPLITAENTENAPILEDRRKLIMATRPRRPLPQGDG